ncbi:(2Fe-2S)-binding protein [Actinoplanes sp. NBC_00393]|uniref:(2Fe-2S)-binding protein n=1 Tax=Actinoplanes sp. NBC_00393 TaxID=2975953 RepID=UPI002E2092F7
MTLAGAALHAAARFGPYFAWDPYDETPGWRPLTDLLDADVVADRVETGRQALLRMSGLTRDDIEERVVASIVFLGLASRLLSPLLGAVVAGNVLPLPDPERLWWRPVDGGPLPIAWRDLPAEDCAGRSPADIAETLTRTATRTVVEPVLEVFRGRFRLSPQVLWGNVASALGGAVTMIGQARAAAVVQASLNLAPLRGTATVSPPRWTLVRNNCCLYYRIPGGGTCGDCVLNRREKR